MLVVRTGELGEDLFTKQDVFCHRKLEVYRHSYVASYSVYNIHTREVWELDPPEVVNSVLQYAAWGTQGQQLGYCLPRGYVMPVKRGSTMLGTRLSLRTRKARRSPSGDHQLGC
ncbi:hypothetical protein CRUP_010172 [Coryphaenoides rupestris]|nr:hypothetical protein CRUP_010172 [Coryphaenoides rupestris]